YAEQKYGDKPEYLWERFPQFAAIRKHENKKWYCLLGTVEKSKVGLKGDEIIEVANFKIVPKELPELLKKPGYLPAYHMNKKSWVTVVLDGTVPLTEIKKLLDKSYTLA
ncbi:MAG: MmcQ/YjbR family DNA-binding protein, partial [Fibrobacter sp.]|uniref:MmcQ/YjbR family DNA-binding protein n=1 Tax=Fibrobacter sp. TaxID=35828 RepID=UPI0025C2F979